MTARFAESVVEDAALAWLEGIGYAAAQRPGAIYQAEVDGST